INSSTLDVAEHAVVCLTFADLTQQNADRREIERLQTERLRELERGQDALTQQATHDALTGLPNRSLLRERAVYALDQPAMGGPATSRSCSWTSTTSSWPTTPWTTIAASGCCAPSPSG
ncbi:MAG: GGDEF domain-containing protein, partial [Actinomycetota bacterium]|nr:GGDEF domain-containing protein [Actinomycetota bacterium]